MPESINQSDPRKESAFAPDRPRKRRFSWRIKFLAVGAAILAALLLAEIALRFSPIDTAGLYMRADHWTGTSPRPNAKGVLGIEQFAHIRINSLGLRDNETTIAKPKGTKRIALLGDSYAEAAQMALEYAVSEQLEARLNEAGSYEVLNFGVSGYGTAQEYLRLREYALRFEPDLVMVMVTLGNDIRNNHRELNGVSYIPYFTVDPEGQLQLDASFRDDPKYRRLVGRDSSVLWKTIAFAWDHSRLAGLVFSTLASENRRPPVEVKSANAPIDPAFRGDWQIYDPHPEGAWVEAWQVTELLILEMRRLCQQHSLPFVVVLVSNSPQVSKKGRSLFAEKYPLLDLDYPNRRVLDFCHRKGIACIDLMPVLLGYHRRTEEFVHGFGERLGEGHWNETGHRIAAEEIYQFLKEQRLLSNLNRGN